MNTNKDKLAGGIGDGSRLSLGGIVLCTLLAALAFHLAYVSAATGFLILVYLFALLQLAQAPTWRKAFYSGLAVGLLIAIGRLGFFWRIFSTGAIALWLVYAVWIGLFVALARLCLTRLRPGWGWALIPVVWCGLEYFRSELYYLRFSWLAPAFAPAPAHLPLRHIGSYGVGFLLMAVACATAAFWPRSGFRSLAALVVGISALRLWSLAGGTAPEPALSATVRVAGVQMEFPAEAQVLARLNDLIRAQPETELVVLSEYTFTDPVPATVRDWCRQQHRYLIVGGIDPAPNSNFYNTAFVIDPRGQIIFRQVKSVPIQFFKDGLPAPRQALWESPWGKLGICVCYDLNYSRVADRLIELGAQALIVPTMDVADWGQSQHQLHARVAPVRAAEYGIPIFRLASSGISQLVDRAGHIVASAPCLGDEAILSGSLELRGSGTLPLDRWLAPAATGVTTLAVIWMLISSAFARSRAVRSTANSPMT